MTLPNMSDDVRRLNPQLASELRPVTPSKYKNARTTAKGMTFQSGREAAGVAELILLEEQHIIFGLRLQVAFDLDNGEKYRADAVYLELKDRGLQPVIWEAKGYETRDWKRKRRLFEKKYKTEITVV